MLAYGALWDTAASLVRSLPGSIVDIRTLTLRNTGQIPWLDKFLNKNPILTVIGKKASGSYIGSFAFNRLQHRLADTSTTKPTNDFLSHYIAVQAEDPENISKEYVLAWTVSNIIAGSDSTAITLCSVFYHLLKNPASLAKLRAELDAAEDAGLISNDEIISWSTSQKLPFLNAAIMEAMRLHPAVGQIFERVTPEGGRKVCGRYFPEGTLVGISPWVVHQDKGVYGEDADVWRPERWIEADEEAMGAMQRTFFVFGSGSRTCVGRNIGRLNTFKLVPQILRDYDVSNSALV